MAYTSGGYVSDPALGGTIFSVSEISNVTVASAAETAAWAAEGCVVAGSQTATTVSGLGAQSAAAGYQSCAITCPTDGGDFAVSASGAGSARA